MAMKDLVCQTCKKSVLNVGFYHDETLAMKCKNCHGMIFPTTKAEEDKNRTLLKGPNSNAHWNQNRDLLPIKIAPAARACGTESQQCGL